MKLSDTHYFVVTWDGFLYGTKGCFMNQRTGKILPVKGQAMLFVDLEKVKKEGIPILTGKRRAEFLRRFNLMLDPETRVVRKRKR